MKVIRHGVFETNSSSTHSVSLRHFTEKELKEKKYPECTIRISSPLYKTMFLRGLINYNIKYNSVYDLETDEYAQDKMDDRLQTFYDGCKKILSPVINVPFEDIDRHLEDLFNNIDYDSQPAVKNFMKKGMSRQEAIEKFKKDYRVELTCEHFFENGCLDECFCGMNSINSVVRSLRLYEENPVTPEQFMSEEYAFILCEKYSGCIFLKDNEVL